MREEGEEGGGIRGAGFGRVVRGDARVEEEAAEEVEGCEEGFWR